MVVGFGACGFGPVVWGLSYGACRVGPTGVFLGLRLSIHKHRRINLGKKLCGAPNFFSTEDIGFVEF